MTIAYKFYSVFLKLIERILNLSFTSYIILGGVDVGHILYFDEITYT